MTTNRPISVRNVRLHALVRVVPYAVSLSALVAVILVPAKMSPATGVTNTCPGDVDTCSALLNKPNCTVDVVQKRTNPINICSNSCENQLPFHEITGSQTVYTFIKWTCDDGTTPAVQGTGSPPAPVCESTDVTYGPTCGGPL
jgi:hypothetical protein